MTAGGALAVLLSSGIKPLEALRAVNWEVMLFLFSMFLIGTALEESGYLARLARLALILLAGLILIKIVAGLFSAGSELKLVYITTIAALPILIFSPRRFELIRKVDWHTLIFFAAMFVLMASVWQTGFSQSLIARLQLNLRSLPVIVVVSVLLSQFISNVPLGALYLPILLQNGVSDRALMALAAGSTIAGNMLIMGAGSNVIIIQNAERWSGETITMTDFARIGIALTLLNALVYLGFLYLV